MLAQIRKQETDESKLNDLVNEKQRLTSTLKQLKSETLKLRQQLEVTTIDLLFTADIENF